MTDRLITPQEAATILGLISERDLDHYRARGELRAVETSTGVLAYPTSQILALAARKNPVLGEAIVRTFNALRPSELDRPRYAGENRDDYDLREYL